MVNVAIPRPSKPPGTRCPATRAGCHRRSCFAHARGWTAAWAAINDVTLPNDLPASYAPDARAAGFRTTRLFDDPIMIPEDIQVAVRDYVSRQVSGVRETIFRHHGL